MLVKSNTEGRPITAIFCFDKTELFLFILMEVFFICHVILYNNLLEGNSVFLCKI